MENLGLYTINDSKTIQGIDSSAELTKTWKRTTLLYNGEKIATTLDETDNCGIRVSDNKLILNGESIAEDFTGELIDDSDGIKFGNTTLIAHNKCINITKANYNKLILGEVVSGYRTFNPETCYNIVENIEDPIPYCLELTDLHDPLYNNLYDPLKDTPGHTNNPYDLTDNELTDLTYFDTNAPHLSTHGYDFEIEPGQLLEITYMVDTRTGDKINRLTIDDTFTTIIKDASGNILFKNTTYAGVFKVKLAPFMNGSLYYEGETWFSIQCINKAGVGSIVHFLDVWIRTKPQEKLYCPSLLTLRLYGIVDNFEGTERQPVAYMNKKLLGKLCQEVADGVYGDYNGLKLPNTGNTIYYLDPHKNYNSEDNDNVVMPTRLFKLVRRVKSGNSHYNLSQAISPGATLRVIVGYETKIENGKETQSPIIKEWKVKANETPLDFIRRDGAHIHRVQPEEVNCPICLAIGYGNTDKNHTSDNTSTAHDGEVDKLVVHNWDVGKTWVTWREDPVGSYDKANEKFVGWATKTELDKNGKPVQVVRLDYDHKWLRTYSNHRSSEYATDIDEGYFYMVESDINVGTNPKAGDSLTLPDHFTLDLNGATIQMSKALDLREGNLIEIRRNFDTHIKNGTLKGFFNLLYNEEDEQLQFDSTIFKDLRFVIGVKHNTPYESLRMLDIVGSKYCSAENLKICNDIGYSGIIDSRETSGGLSNSGYGTTTPWSINFNTVGYIDGCLEGENGTINTAAPLKTNVSMSPRIDAIGDISLVCTSEYINCEDKDSTVAILFPNEFLFYMPQNAIFSCGKLRELFVAFYDENKNYLTAVKSAFNKAIKKPENAKFMRLTGYGFSVVENGVRKVPTYTVTLDNKKRYTPFEIVACGYFEFSRCCSYKDCLFENTRTIAFYPAGARNALYDRCTWKQIANLPRINWFVTLLWGDVEEGWQIGDGITIKDSTIEYDPQFSEGEYTYLHRHLTNSGCKDLTIINTDGISMGLGATEDAYIVDSTFSNFTMGRVLLFEHPCINIRNCGMRSKLSTSLDTNLNTVGIKNGDYNYGVFRKNFCDDPIVTDVAFQDLFAINGGSFSGEMNYKIRRSRIGNTIYK